MPPLNEILVLFLEVLLLELLVLSFSWSFSFLSLMESFSN